MTALRGCFIALLNCILVSIVASCVTLVSIMWQCGHVVFIFLYSHILMFILCSASAI